MNVDFTDGMLHAADMLMGNELKKAIESLNISQAKFARECGLSLNTIRLLMANKIRFPSVRVVIAVEGVLARKCECCGQLTAKPKRQKSR